MDIFGVVNASPDSLNEESKISGADEMRPKVAQLLRDGADAIDLGGAGSTPQAARVETEEEWARLEGPIAVMNEMDVEFSIDTWQPEIARRGLDAGGRWMNAADGLQHPAMIELAIDYRCPVVLPFLSGTDPKAMSLVTGDPIEVVVEWFEQRIAQLTTAGVRRDQLIVDPGTGFGPADWAWEDRYVYQKGIYSNLERLREFDLPLYIALPWKETDQHDELLEIVLRHGVEFGRAHFPAKVRRVESAIRAEIAL